MNNTTSATAKNIKLFFDKTHGKRQVKTTVTLSQHLYLGYSWNLQQFLKDYRGNQDKAQNRVLVPNQLPQLPNRQAVMVKYNNSLTQGIGETATQDTATAVGSDLCRSIPSEVL